MSRLKHNSRVTTPNGVGTVVDFEQWRTGTRVGVKLDNNPFSWPVAYFFENEIKTIENETN